MREKHTIASPIPHNPAVPEVVTNAVHEVLKYFELFLHPLRADEVQRFCPVPCTITDVKTALNSMEKEGKVHHSGNYYSLSKDILPLIEKREKGNKLSEIKISKAKRVGGFIYSFPFVRFVGISGSLSKGYAEKKSDFDFFIITASDRLWICRTLLHLFKKLTFIAGQQHKFCMNYFIDESALLLTEKNKYTATELFTLIPVKGPDMYKQLLDANGWMFSYFPNNLVCPDNGNAKTFYNPFKKIAEGFFNISFPGKLNLALMKITDAKWKKKWARKDFPMSEYNLAFKTTPHISKNHPLNHQKKVLDHLKMSGATNK